MESRTWTGIEPSFLVERAPGLLASGGVFLDSAGGGDWSHLALASATVILTPDRAWLHPEGQEPPVDLGEPGEALDALMTPLAGGGNSPSPFAGGLIGYLGYGAGAYFDRIPPERQEAGAPPTGVLYWSDAVASLDHRTGELHLSASGRSRPGSAGCQGRAGARLAELESRLRAPVSHPLEAACQEGLPPELPPSTPFEAGVRAGREAIGRGDVFQVNLAQRFELGLVSDPWATYLELRRRNPAPYAGFMNWHQLQLLSASPELLFETRGARVETRPIAGTFPRAKDPARDGQVRAALQAHPKERAEHVMLVDLARNDLGRVAKFGSVVVEDLLGVESYATVHHLVSIVAAQLRSSVRPVEVLAALFPGGTITGAPKIRATEIIHQLEPRARGPYTGSLGFWDQRGDQAWNISIRTLVVQSGAASVHAGAGIVWDSIPEREYRESVQKAKAFLELVGVSTQGADLVESA